MTSDTLQKMIVPDWRNSKVQPGDKVLLRKGHPHAGRIGIYEGVERIPAMGKYGCLVRFEDEIGGDKCYVLNADFWQKVTNDAVN